MSIVYSGWVIARDGSQCLFIERQGRSEMIRIYPTPEGGTGIELLALTPHPLTLATTAPTPT